MKIDFPEITRVSHSRIKTWRRCQMQHHYKYYQGLQSRSKARPLEMGSLLHNMIEAHHETGSYLTVWKKYKAEYDKLFQEEQLDLGDIPAEALSIVRRYFSHYKNDKLSYPARRRGKNTELRVQVPIGNNIEFLGLIDAMPEDDQGRVWYMDHKSHKHIPNEEVRFSDLQLLIYTWLAPQLGYPTADGIIWDYLRTKAPIVPEVLKAGGISKNKNIDTTYDVYMETVISKLGPNKAVEYEEFAQTLKGKEDSFFKRVYLPAPKQVMVKAIVEDITVSAQEIAIRGPESRVRNMTRDCSSCSYYNLCQAEVRGLDIEHIISTDFTTKEQRDAKEKAKQSHPKTGSR